MGKGDVDVKEIKVGCGLKSKNVSEDPRYKNGKKNLVRKLLREESEVFALTKNDIGDVPDFEMKVNLTVEFRDLFKKK